VTDVNGNGEARPFYPFYGVHISCVNNSLASYQTIEPRDVALRELVSFLQKMDHEGATWEAEETLSEGDRHDITNEVQQLYFQASVRTSV